MKASMAASIGPIVGGTQDGKIKCSDFCGTSKKSLSHAAQKRIARKRKNIRARSKK